VVCTDGQPVRLANQRIGSAVRRLADARRAFEVAALSVVDFLPFLLFTLPAGVWVDRLPRRPIMVAADVGRALALASIPVAVFAGDLTLSQLYVVGFVTGTLTVFFEVAYQSYLPSLVARREPVDTISSTT
jgi:MFS family permease